MVIRKMQHNFKLHPKLGERLRREAQRTRRTQTAIVEMALEQALKCKRGEAA